jgi:hypothetical protein
MFHPMGLRLTSAIYAILMVVATALVALAFFIGHLAASTATVIFPPLDGDAVALNVGALFVGTVMALAFAGIQKLCGRPLSWRRLLGS